MKNLDANTRQAVGVPGRLPYTEQFHEAGIRKTFILCETLSPLIPHFGKTSYSIALPELPRHTHSNCFEIHYILKGQFHWELCKQEFYLHPNDVFISMPNQPHGGLHSFMEPGELYFLQIDAGKNTPDLSPLLSNLEKLPIQQFQVGPEVPILMDWMFAECSSPSNHAKQAQHCRLNLLLVELLRFAAEAIEDKCISPGIQESLNFFNSHPLGFVTINRMQQASGLRRSEFYRRFTGEIGESPNTFLIRRKIDAARIVLRETDRAITDIALDLGFSSSQYFATVFRRYTGFSPRSYRRQL